MFEEERKLERVIEIEFRIAELENFLAERDPLWWRDQVNEKKQLKKELKTLEEFYENKMNELPKNKRQDYKMDLYLVKELKKMDMNANLHFEEEQQQKSLNRMIKMDAEIMKEKKERREKRYELVHQIAALNEYEK